MATTIIPNDTQIQGNLILTGSIQPPIQRTALAQQDEARHKIALEDWRVWDAYATLLTATAASDDLALVGGTFGTAHPSIQTGDLKNAGATTRYARIVLTLPHSYVAAETIKIRLSAGMLTTVASSAATVDVEAYRHDEDTTLTGSDICATAAQSINSLTFANKDFVITSTTLGPGDSIDVRIAIAVNDSATATAVIGCVGGAELLLDVKG
jgi:hypothetical protein